MNDFIFNFIFENEKETFWTNANIFRSRIRRKYGIVSPKDETRLYIAINQYQVKKYGHSVQPQNIRTKEDYLQRARTVRQARYDRKR